MPTTTPNLQGAEGILRVLAPRLNAATREIIDRLRTQYNVTEDRIPYFTEVAVPPRQLTSIGEYPIVMLKVDSTTGRLDNTEGAGSRLADVYRRVYRVRAIILALGPSMDAVELQVQRLALAVRDGVLLDRLLIDTDEDGFGPSAEVLTNDLTENYADPAGVEAGFAGSAEISFNVKAKELVLTTAAYRGGLPYAGDVNVEASRFLS